MREEDHEEYSFASFLNFTYEDYKQSLRDEYELGKVMGKILLENALFREALMPFANADIDDEWKDEDDISVHVMVRDIRKALKVLERGDE